MGRTAEGWQIQPPPPLRVAQNCRFRNLAGRLASPWSHRNLLNAGAFSCGHRPVWETMVSVRLKVGIGGRGAMDQTEETLTCGQCRKSGTFTAPVSVILLFAPGLSKPYPLIPAEDYRVCGACDAIFTLVNRAADAHPTTRQAGPWSRAIIVFADGHGVDVKAKRPQQAVALA